jgi:hypothetical protein
LQQKYCKHIEIIGNRKCYAKEILISLVARRLLHEQITVYWCALLTLFFNIKKVDQNLRSSFIIPASIDILHDRPELNGLKPL